MLRIIPDTPRWPGNGADGMRNPAAAPALKATPVDPVAKPGPGGVADVVYSGWRRMLPVKSHQALDRPSLPVTLASPRAPPTTGASRRRRCRSNVTSTRCPARTSRA